MNPLLMEEVLKNKGELDLDFSNPVHFDHIMTVLGLKNDSDSPQKLKSNKDGSKVEPQAKPQCNTLMEVLKSQKTKDGAKVNKAKKLLMTKNNDANQPDEERNVYYITAPACKINKTPNLKASKGLLADNAPDSTLMSSSVAKYIETKAGIMSNVYLRESATGKKIASCFDKVKNSSFLISSITGDYSDFMGSQVNNITGYGTAITVGEDSNGDTKITGKVTATNDFSIMSTDDAVQEFTVLDPVVKRPNKPANEPIRVSYRRNSQMGEYDYSIENSPNNGEIKLMLPIKFSVQSKEDVTIVDLDRDRGFRVYFDDPNGGQCQYCNDLDDAQVEFESINGKVRKITVTMPQDWNTLYNFANLENKVSVNMSIYAEFYVKFKVFDSIDISLSVTFKNDDQTTFTDTRNKLIPKIYMQWGCIGDDTKIKKFNPEKNTIEEVLVAKLKIGDTIVSLNGKKAVIRNIYTGDDQSIWKIGTEHHHIRLTSTHSILTKRGWIPVCDIRTDDLIMTENGPEKITDYDYVDYNAKVYNFRFDEQTPLYGNGIIIGDYEMQQNIRSVFDKKVKFSEKTQKTVDELFALRT